MNRISKSALLLGAALAVLSACSGTKGPGEIGTKDDIVVRNNGLPGANQTAAASAEGDFSSTIEQAEAVPAPAVAAAEPLPDTSPAVEAAAQQVADAKAPLASTTATPTADMGGSATTPSTGAKPIDQVVPETPVQDATVAPPAPTATASAAPAVAPAPTPVAEATPQAAPSAVYPASDYAPAAAPTAPAAEPMAAPAPAAPVTPSANAYVPVPPGTDYPLDPNAPYSPKAMAGVTASGTASTTTPTATDAATTAAPVSASGLNLSDPAVIRSAQAALKTKAGYAGEVSGTVDAAFLNALTVYQGMNKLPVGGLNEATLRHLGVIE